MGWSTIHYPTVPYPTPRSSSGLFNCSRMKCVGVGVNIGWGTLPYPTLVGRSEHWVGCPALPEFKWAVQAMKCRIF